MAHTEPIFKELQILKFADKLSFCRLVFMHQYRHNKLPISFSNTFTDIVCSDTLQTRHNDYNYLNAPAVKKYLENFPYKKIISTWNSLKIDLKATAEPDEFYYQLRDTFIDGYSCDTHCVGPCYSCGTNKENFV